MYLVPKYSSFNVLVLIISDRRNQFCVFWDPGDGLGTRSASRDIKEMTIRMTILSYPVKICLKNLPSWILGRQGFPRVIWVGLGTHDNIIKTFGIFCSKSRLQTSHSHIFFNPEGKV